MQVSDLRDIHKGKLCFIYGAGPSLHYLDTEPLKPYVSIAVNSGLLRAKWCDYFLSDDVGVSSWRYYIDLLPTLPCLKLLYRDKLKTHCGHLSNVLLFSHTWWYSPADEKYNPPGILLTKDEPIIGAINSVGSALHFAYIMGCNPVVMLGCDCCYKEGHRYFWQYDGEEKTERIPPFKTHVYDSYYESYYTGRSVMYWNALAEANDGILKKEMITIDASDGILTCFPKMTVDEVLRSYGERVKDGYDSERRCGQEENPCREKGKFQRDE
jgi:hypothetical protein